MIVIADTNVIVSYLITPTGIIADIIDGKSNIQLFAPEYMLEEIEEHLDKISLLSSLTKHEIKSKLSFLKERIAFYPIKNIPKGDVDKAYSIVQDIDEDDKYFVALHLHIKHRIWTGDKVLINGLKKKGYNVCITTNQLKKSLYK